ncbi:Uncharacterized protein TCM_009404 [Theobroma cacao]|uniref:Uncharacterized protein n=1 Tax=Theobroma cacao TaxID=3641 RepID=A0A061E4T4_THECC|nr:Uncharacterized protein TCM_009404 [Theobroma cacao]
MDIVHSFGLSVVTTLILFPLIIRPCPKNTAFANSHSSLYLTKAYLVSLAFMGLGRKMSTTTPNSPNNSLICFHSSS